MALANKVNGYWLKIQVSLFPWLDESLGETTEKEQKLIITLDIIRIERFVSLNRSLRGRPPEFSVYASPVLFVGLSDSATGATLNTGGWLDLTRQGLSPCKTRQSPLDEITPA